MATESDVSFLKNKMMDKEERSFMFSVFQEYCVELCNHPNGNYVIQKYFELGTTQEKNKLAKLIYPEVATLVFQAYSSRVVQKALCEISQPMFMKFVKQMYGKLPEMAFHQTGCHVIHRVLENAPLDVIDHIAGKELKGHLVDLITKQYSCRIVQKLMDMCSPRKLHEMVEELVGISARDLVKLCCHSLGNYTIQHIFKKQCRALQTKLFHKIETSLERLCMDKFSSNVVESMWNSGNAEVQDGMMCILFQPVALSSLANHKYGNYVIQRMVTTAHRHSSKRDRMLQLLESTDLQSSEFGRFIICKLENIKNRMTDGHKPEFHVR